MLTSLLVAGKTPCTRAEDEEALTHTQRRGKSVPEGRGGGGKDRTAGQTQQTDRPTNPYVASLYVRNRLRPCLISA